MKFTNVILAIVVVIVGLALWSATHPAKADIQIPTVTTTVTINSQPMGVPAEQVPTPVPTYTPTPISTTPVAPSAVTEVTWPNGYNPAQPPSQSNDSNAGNSYGVLCQAGATNYC